MKILESKFREFTKITVKENYQSCEIFLFDKLLKPLFLHNPLPIGVPICHHQPPVFPPPFSLFTVKLHQTKPIHSPHTFNEDDGMVNSSKRNDFTEIGIQFREGNLPKNKTYITKLEFLAHRSNATFYNPAPPMKSIQVSPYVFVSFSFTNTSS